MDRLINKKWIFPLYYLPQPGEMYHLLNFCQLHQTAVKGHGVSVSEKEMQPPFPSKFGSACKEPFIFKAFKNAHTVYLLDKLPWQKNLIDLEDATNKQVFSNFGGGGREVVLQTTKMCKKNCSQLWQHKIAIPC